ncbi:DUF3127 domain-containing protein [Aestuariicella hydrocarbonica]|uniref:DUF3127 domain-containing protein n=1 Tax=Pseudomaricurvus hydrocarbonicus TaxID=1470433 RepID=A0A9E5JSB0_9GAMM|nr:DUF3127 domain-containing protein [Aestuariicella hydrocarbonica]NHO65853.1 DUF3127 domain-containing protein [Aestuariicella hydrocarbonica]
MSNSFETQGVIHSIGDTTEYGNNGFIKREFVIRVTGEGVNEAYPNYLAMELVKDNCGIMDAYNLGDEIKVHFNLNGRLWSPPGKPEKCFNSLQAWRIEPMTQNVQNDSMPPGFDQGPPLDAYDDDVPF